MDLAKETTPVATTLVDVPVPPGSEVTHVTTSYAMENYHFENVTDAFAETIAWRPDTDATTRLQILHEVFEALASTGRLLPKTDAYLGRERLWLSTETDFGNPLSERSAASRIRDTRGLIHLEATDFLVGYSLHWHPTQKMKRPTALDGVGRRFRHWSNEDGLHEPFGTTVDLRKFAEEAEQMDGVAEGIVASVKLDSDVIKNVTALGHPVTDDGIVARGLSSKDDDVAFADRIAFEGTQKGLPDAELYLMLRGGK